MTPLGMRDKLAFGLLCKARIDHEAAEHEYVHEQVRIAKARYDWGRSSRHIYSGQNL